MELLYVGLNAYYQRITQVKLQKLDELSCLSLQKLDELSCLSLQKLDELATTNIHHFLFQRHKSALLRYVNNLADGVC